MSFTDHIHIYTGAQNDHYNHHRNKIVQTLSNKTPALRNLNEKGFEPICLQQPRSVRWFEYRFVVPQTQCSYHAVFASKVK
jgi:hypothetical protein